MYACICEMVFLACTEHTSIMSPVIETQDYDYLHRVKGADQIWSFRYDMCRIENQKDMKCVPFAVNVCVCEMLFLTCTEHTSTMSPELMKLRIMIISIKTKILIKFGIYEMMCMCRIEGQRAMKYVPFAINVYYVKCSSSNAQNTLQPCHQLVKLSIMTISIKIKVMIKFRASEMICVELRAKKL